MKTTVDGLLNRFIMLEQPAEGYRVAIDTVLLAAAVPARDGEKALELGCGVGGAMLCLANRVPGISIVGLEIDSELAALCQSNIERNNFPTHLEVRQGDVTKLPDNLAGLFDHVFMNPPYHDEARHEASPNDRKRTANTEKDGDLALWVASADRALKTGGCLTLIHRADRAPEILNIFKQYSWGVDAINIVPKAGAPAKRIIMHAYKDKSAPAMNSVRDFILHKADGGYTEAAEAILRDGAALPG